MRFLPYPRTLALLALLAAGCSGGANPFDPGGFSGRSGISGSVEIGPTMPVCRADQSCYVPYQATVTVVDAGGEEITRFRTDAGGRFSVALPPGSYTLVPEQSAQGSIPAAFPVTVEVLAGRYTTVLLVYDTGIA